MASSFISAGIAVLTALTAVQAQDVITEDSYFFGESPAVFPSPEMSSVGPWSTAYARAKALVAQMTIEEKVNLTAGTSAPNGCSGTIPAIDRLGFPGMCVSDAGQGLRGTDFVSSWPSGLHVGASWNKELTYKRGMGMGGEFKRKGVNMLLGPVVGPLGRVVEGGRNWEGYSVDPYLGGALVHETVVGVQGVGVITSTKHYIANEQETDRNPTTNNSAISTNIDDVTLHELYLWPFQDAVHAGTGNIMCSYQRINNSYGCQNSKTLNGILKGELGFQGFVVSDWYAQHSGVDSALAGLDVAMPNGGIYWGDNLTLSVSNGSVSESRVDDMATRVIASWYQMGQDKSFPDPGIGMPANLSLPHDIVDARDPLDKPILYAGAVEGHVLVKNTNSALPLKKPRLLSLFGYSAKAPDKNNYDGAGFSAWTLGLEAGDDGMAAELTAAFTGESKEPLSAIAANGTILSGGGSGATSQSNFISPFDALVSRADEDNTQLYWDFNSPIPNVMGASDACLVFGNAFATEGVDRPGLRDDYTDGLVLHVASLCANTIVILHNAGIRLVDQWIEHDNVTAVIFAHLPGQETGKALVSLLYGDENFSGKLPYTVARNESDYGSVLHPDQPEGQFLKFPQSNFSEGRYIDYRYFDREGIEPRFEFGFGLSYTTFEYSNLQVSNIATANTATYPTGDIVEGGQTDLWDIVARVRADVTNTGSVDGAEVAQVFVGIPGAPARQLRGFEKPRLSAGETTTVTFDLTRRDLSVWDVVAQKWGLQSGSYQIYVGGSSRDLPLTGTLSVSNGNYTRRRWMRRLD
ncbi:glycoside hydrolase family 3 protein [Dactylonectria macrodidyma]|uniref:beta-glucosidase n=1 Tax=Dactylonectria macrodidyma TaxID=307937 RepID=A0A9P9IJG9_9HYPO|nr:glycoside hydrolase family 3 protein [Dactylonectria macrodidyma]